MLAVSALFTIITAAAWDHGRTGARVPCVAAVVVLAVSLVKMRRAQRVISAYRDQERARKS
jgi:hypothetical protein